MHNLKSSYQILTLEFKSLIIAQIHIFQLSFINLAGVLAYFGKHSYEKWGSGFLVTALQTIPGVIDFSIHLANVCFCIKVHHYYSHDAQYPAMYE